MTDFEDEAFERASDAFRRRRRKERLPKSTGQLLSRLISQTGLAESEWADLLQEHWEAVIDRDLAGRTRPTLVRRGQLEVRVDSSAAIQQLAFVKSELLAKMQQRLPQAKLTSIRFRVGPLK